MRASTVAAVLFAAAAASPALAAPHYARSNAAELLLARQANHVARSEPVYIAARQDAGTDQSGAFNFLNALKTAASIFLKRELTEREVHEILARQDASADQSGAFNFLNALKTAASIFLKRELTEREVSEILARADVSADESGAFGFGDVFKIFQGLVHKREFEELMAREDIQDLLARQNVDVSDPSGAGLLSFAGKLIGPILGLFGGNNNNRREIEEFFAREDVVELLARQSVDPNDASGAGLFSIAGKLIGPILGLFGGNNNNRREIEEFFAREDVLELMARQSVDPNDASGAGLLSIAGKLIGPLLGGIFGGNNKRDMELMELFARQQVDAASGASIADFLQKLFPNIHRRELEELVARQSVDPNDASGAGLFSIAGKLIGPILGLFGGNNNNRREIEEFFAREDVVELLARQSVDPNDASGAGLFSIASKLIGPILGLFGGNNNNRREIEEFFAREDVLELMARQSVDPNDASGAGLLSIAGKLIGPLLGGIFGGGNNNKREFLEAFARELEHSARSLNQLD